MAKKSRKSPNPGLTPSDLMNKIKAEVAEEPPRKPTRSIFSKPPAEPELLTEPTPTIDIRGVTTEEGLSELVRQVMQAPTEEDNVTLLRQMVTQVAIKASKGDQWAVEWIGNRIEGKPGQAPKRTTSIEEVEQAIDQVEVAALNRLTEPQDQEPS
jgi:hypothetical protein